MDNEIRRATGLLVIEVVNSNPNGDPDRESDPRQRPNGCGEISPVSFKRKLRDLLDDHDTPFSDLCRRSSAQTQTGTAFWNIADGTESRSQRKWVMNRKNSCKVNLSANTGTHAYSAIHSWKTAAIRALSRPASCSSAWGFPSHRSTFSARRIQTKQACRREKCRHGAAGLSDCGAWRLLYAVFVNPNYAQKSGCTAEDIELLKLLIPHAYELNRSAIRPDVLIRHAWYLEHKSLLGSCPDYQLLEALTPEKLGDRNEPSSSWADYQDKTQLPETLRARMASCVDLINP